MIEQNAVRSVHIIGFAIIDGDPIGVELSRRIGRTGIKWRGLALRYFLRHTVKFRRRGLVEAHLLFQAQDANGFEQAQSAERVGIGGVFGRLKRHAHVALCREIIDLGRLHLLHDANEIGRIRHVAVVQEEPHAGTVRVLVQMIDPRGVERRRAPLDAVDHITFAEQKLGEICAVLAGRAGDHRNTICHPSHPAGPGVRKLTARSAECRRRFAGAERAGLRAKGLA
jgi:hypothetical protein